MKQPGQSQLEQLPNELLAQTFHYLPTTAIANAAFTCRTFSAPATDALYRHVYFARSGRWLGEQATTQLPNTVLAFFCTISRHPNLAKTVRCLEMTVEPGDLRWPVGWRHAYPLPGTLLTSLMALNTLKIDVCQLFDFSDEGNPLLWLFPGARVEAVLASAFRNLTYLKWTAVTLPECIACLPRLQTLALNKACIMPDVRKWRHVPKFTHLTIKRFTSLFLEMQLEGTWSAMHDHQHFFDFLIRCSSLVDLEILLYDAGENSPDHFPSNQTLGNGKFADLDLFTRRLQQSVPSLESLQIGPTDAHPAWWLDYVDPITSLRAFTRLQSLRLPEQFLLSSVPMCDALPSSLQQLQIDCPSLDAFSILQMLLEDEGELPNLKRVTLHCADNGRGLEFAPWLPEHLEADFMRYHWNRSLAVQCLCTTEMRPILTHSGVQKVWEDKYEEGVAEVVEFLSPLPAAAKPSRMH